MANGDDVAERVRAAQDRALVGYVREHVAPFSSIHAEELRGFRAARDLAGVPVRRLADVPDPRSLVLHPDEATLSARAPLGMEVRLWWAQLTRRQEWLNRTVLEPVYKPIHWHTDSGVPLGYSAEDLERLSEIGRAGLELAGVGPYDSLVGLVAPGPSLGYWQLVLGARRGGVPSVHLGAHAAAADVVSLAPTVLAGGADALVRSVAEDAGRLASVERFLVVGDPPSARRRVEQAVAPRPVHVWWAPPGTRALWTECTGRTGLHTWAATELVEVVDPLSGRPERAAEGELVWSPIGWKGSVLLRTYTGATGRVEEGTCPGCGRSSPRIVPASLPWFADVLDGHPDIAAWQAELLTAEGAEELHVFLAPTRRGSDERLLRDLDRRISPTRLVVLSRREMAARLAEGGGEKVLDLREGH